MHVAKWLCKCCPRFVGGERKARKKTPIILIATERIHARAGVCRNFTFPFALLLYVHDVPLVVTSELCFCLILSSVLSDLILSFLMWREAEQHLLFVCIQRLREALQMWGICCCNSSLAMMPPSKKCLAFFAFKIIKGVCKKGKTKSWTNWSCISSSSTGGFLKAWKFYSFSKINSVSSRKIIVSIPITLQSACFLSPPSCDYFTLKKIFLIKILLLAAPCSKM